MTNLSFTACSFYITRFGKSNSIIPLNHEIDIEVEDGNKYLLANSEELLGKVIKSLSGKMNHYRDEKIFRFDDSSLKKLVYDDFVSLCVAIKSGSYGDVSDIVNIDTGENQYKKKRKDAEEKTFYLYIVIPKDSEQVCVNTLFEDRRADVKHLKKLMERWGFCKHGYKENGELVLVKSLETYDETKDPKYNFPVIKDNPRYYLLPIFPQYHTDLFPDMILKNEDMHLYEDKKAHRYALEKIYLSGRYKTDAQPGDIMVIYRVAESDPKRYKSVLTGIVVIESITDTMSVEECLALCKNRSVFEESEIVEMHNRRPKVIKLLDYMPFVNKIPLNYLWQQGIVAQWQGPMTFDPITKEQYDNIYKLGTE